MHPEKTRSIRPFIGAQDFDLSREFYTQLGFDEVPLGNMSYFHINNGTGFYLQNAYVKDWVDNTMLFLEVEDLDAWLASLQQKQLPVKFPGVRLSGIQVNDWGRELFLHDPSGILWHIGSFAR